jgi:hypothetical protein
MATEKQLLVALDMLTAGAAGDAVPQALHTEAVAVRKDNRSWVRSAGIQGYGIGEKITAGEQLSEVVLKVYVKKKLPVNKLKGAALVPAKVKISSVAPEIPTDVEEIGVVKKEANTTRSRPAIPGYSVGHPRVTAGTIGCVVRKTGNASILYILSNSHVLADEGTAAVGDAIIQPGDADDGTTAHDVIGELAEFVAFNYDTGAYDNFVDAAIAKIKRADITSAIRLIGVPKGVSTVVRRGMHIQKTGRTTDYTTGVIKDINYRLFLSYKKPGGGQGRVGFRDQVLCTRYTAGGDSGSAVLNMSKKIVGLHFAGSPSTSIFNRIAQVTSALSIAIATDVI